MNYLPEEPVYPFNYLKSTVKKNRYWYHCFTADRNFHRLYNHFAEYIDIFRGAKGLISADFSLFRDYPEEVLIENCRKNRLIDYALQQAGIPIIPTAGFAGESSWEWCFDGLPLNSTVAVTTNCLGRDREAHRLFVGGINAMVEKIHPTAIVVCGKVPAWLEKNFPDIKIIHIPSYSEMWHEREKAKRKLTGKIIFRGGYGGTTVPDGWQLVDYVHGIPELQPNNPNQSLSLPVKSKIPYVAYLLYNKKGVFKQFRVYGGDKRPKFDIDYHNIDGKMSLHKHLYKDGVRQREHIPLTPKEYELYSKFLSR